MAYAIVNGQIVDRSRAMVDIEDRGYQFGDGVYEVIRVYNGKLFTPAEHLERFAGSLHKIGIVPPYTNDELLKILQELVEKNQLQLGIIYMQMTRGAAPRDHAFPKGKVSPALTAYTKETPRPVSYSASGGTAILTEDIRWLRCDIKSLNLLGNVLAKQKASEQNCYEAIQYRGETVTEGSSSNIFMVKDGVIITHPSTQLILKGITKDVVFNICEQKNLRIEERTFSPQELISADEVFLTSTVSEVLPIITINGKQIGGGTPGMITRKLQAYFSQEIENQCGPVANEIRF